MINATIGKFGYPQSLLKEYANWVLLVRPAQVTAGSLVLAAKDDSTAFGSLPPETIAELATIVPELEKHLRSAVNYEKLNYLMLMMVDPHVHFHIFPRYQGDRSIAGMVFADSGWPGPPDLKGAVQLDRKDLSAMVSAMRFPEVRPGRI